MKRSAWSCVLTAGIALSRGLVVSLMALALLTIGNSAALAAAPQRVSKATLTKPTPTLVTPSVRPHRVIAYYFHTTYRCPSCKAIEAYSHDAIQSAFADQLKDGRLVWKVVNIETEGNEHFAKDYRLFTKSLILVNENRGKPAEWKNLEKVWELLRDKEAFFRYVQNETRSYLDPRS
jgi:hypothetical protein